MGDNSWLWVRFGLMDTDRQGHAAASAYVDDCADCPDYRRKWAEFKMETRIDCNTTTASKVWALQKTKLLGPYGQSAGRPA